MLWPSPSSGLVFMLCQHCRLFPNAFLPQPQVTTSFPDPLHSPAGEYENKGLMIIDEEEFMLILKLKDLKEQYRTEYQDLCKLKAEIQYCQHLVNQCRLRLLTGLPFRKVGWPPEVQGGTTWVLEVYSELLSGRDWPGLGLQMCEAPLTVLSPHLPAEFEIWYNESFIPEDMQVALKPGGNTRAGMLPVRRIVSLVSGTRAGVWMMNGHGAVPLAPCSFHKHGSVGAAPSLSQGWPRQMGRCWPLPS